MRPFSPTTPPEHLRQIAVLATPFPTFVPNRGSNDANPDIRAESPL
jgi:hypothetical protein